MSSISKRKNSKGRTVYLARWREHRGAPERSRQFGRKIDAEQFLVGIDGSKLEGSYVDPAAGRITFGEYAEGWLDRKRATVKPSTSATFASHLSGHIIPAFGVAPLRSITREQVKAWAGRLQPGLAPTSARAVAFTLAAVLREAVDDGRIVKNPAERIKVGAKTERRVDPMHIAARLGQGAGAGRGDAAPVARRCAPHGNDRAASRRVHGAHRRPGGLPPPDDSSRPAARRRRRRVRYAQDASGRPNDSRAGRGRRAARGSSRRVRRRRARARVLHGCRPAGDPRSLVAPVPQGVCRGRARRPNAHTRPPPRRSVVAHRRRPIDSGGAGRSRARFASRNARRLHAPLAD